MLLLHSMLRGTSQFLFFVGTFVAVLSLHGCATQLSDEKKQEPSSRPSPKPEPELEIPPEPPLGTIEVENSGLPCDVEAVLKAKCRRCHGSPRRHGAPFSLLRWEDFQFVHRNEPLYVHVGKVVRSGFMPYRIPANPPVEPLTDAEKKVLIDWAQAGGPRGECKPDAGAPDAGASDSGQTERAKSETKTKQAP
jgi:hypothetical protein